MNKNYFYRYHLYNEIPEIKQYQAKENLSLMELPYQINLDYEKNHEAIRLINVNRYPNFNVDELKEKICQINKISFDNNVLIGNGLLEVIQTILLSFTTRETTLIIPDPSFFMFTRLSKICRLNICKIPLTNTLNLDIPAIIQATKKHLNPIVIIDNPNNPTGVLFEKNNLEKIIANCKCPIIIDEAYIAYSKKNSSCLNFITAYDNVIILRSFSKIGFAGLRLGYLISNRYLTSYINKFSLQYSLCDFKIKLALHILGRHGSILRYINEIKTLRDELTTKISNLENIFVPNSQANFIFLSKKNDKSGENTKIEKLNTELIKLGIKINTFPKNLSKVTDNSIRFSIGNKETNDIVLNLIMKNI
ncbi:histidinol-phosphate aminotransferase family protein [Xenorhabdus sp. Reich]|uniref:histidinol-phosphate transaminase n=1 Tax=Xenorhabdus littoralis TaxID=2582835 RepID=A0ABU4SGG4_9GAMM|nr:histidinol-phosphate transaminase [Xenorhabdus sp. Reich]MDX7997732.1 histidinol-phosphate aminotransferase family protein [Xenorhabdus sp. Reich]